jgi:hypothetical protein
MCKTFFVAPGHEAVNRGVWHRAGLLVSVEEDENVAVYAVEGAGSVICVGTYAYGDLDAAAPPVGLLRDHRNDQRASLWIHAAEPAPA